MSLFMTQFSYTSEAWAKLVKNPEDRVAPLKAMAEKLRGRVIDFYHCFGEYDGIVIMEAPDENAAAAIVLAATAATHLKATKTTLLQSVNDARASWSMAASVVYPAPMG